MTASAWHLSVPASSSITSGARSVRSGGASRPLRRVRVRDYDAAKSWYERLLGGQPAFSPHATEAVWELAEHRYLFIVEDGDAPGGASITIFVDDLDALDAEIASRGIEPAERVTYSNGVRKAIYRDADGNEIGFGGDPVEA